MDLEGDVEEVGRVSGVEGLGELGGFEFVWGRGGFLLKGGFGCFWSGIMCWGGGRGAYLERYLPARFAVFTNRRTRA